MKLIKPNNQIKNAINPNKTQIKPKNPAGLGFIKKTVWPILLLRAL